jgi:hypothetical protein
VVETVREDLLSKSSFLNFLLSLEAKIFKKNNRLGKQEIQEE